MVQINPDNSIRFQIPSATNVFCEIKKLKEGYQLTFFDEGKKIETCLISIHQIDREKLRKLVIKVGIEFYALTGPYDAADEILKQWHQNFKRKSLKKRLFSR